MRRASRPGACFNANTDLAELGQMHVTLVCEPTALITQREPRVTFVMRTIKQIAAKPILYYE